MKRVILCVVILLAGMSILSSCDPFKYPTGTWVCEELGITLNFDDYSYTSHRVTDKSGKGVLYYESGRGEIVSSEISLEIICSFSVSGGLAIGYPYINGSYNEYGQREDWLFSGYMEYNNNNEMDYVITNEGEVDLGRNVRRCRFVKEMG